MRQSIQPANASLYIAIAGLALYGDLLKRFTAATTALMATYAIFGVIIVACMAKSFAPEARFLSARYTSFSTISLALIATYLVQLLTNFYSPLFAAFGSALYIVLPLAYIVVIARAFPQFDIVRLGQWFLLLMPPIVAVALVQYFINDSFLVNTSYSETGGIIVRDFIDNDVTAGETFYTRYPSLFASADRLSAMGMMQFFFSVLLFQRSSNMSRVQMLWLLFNFGSAITVLLIAGARSRIIVLAIAIFLAALPILRQEFGKSNKKRVGLVGLVIVGCAFAGADLLAVATGGGGGGPGSSFPVIRQLSATIEQGDVGVRLRESLELSSMPHDVTAFGQGLGVISVGGRPSEFPIRAMWIESGYFWTTLMLLLYGALAVQLLRCLMVEFRKWNGYGIFLVAVPFLMWCLALTAGLTGTFELSTALTLFPAIALMTSGGVVSTVKSRPRAAACSATNGATMDQVELHEQ